MTDYDYDGHLEKLRTIYRKRTELMIHLIEEHLVPHGITYHKAEGGFVHLVYASGKYQYA